MSISIPHEIPFHDVDCFGIVWHGHYYKYFELARTVLYRSCGVDVDDAANQEYLFPVIESHCRYTEALRYGQKVTLTADFREWDYYVLIKYSIYCEQTEKRVAYGYTKQAVCGADRKLLNQVPEAVVEFISSSRISS